MTNTYEKLLNWKQNNHTKHVKERFRAVTQTTVIMWAHALLLQKKTRNEWWQKLKEQLINDKHISQCEANIRHSATKNVLCCACVTLDNHGGR